MATQRDFGTHAVKGVPVGALLYNQGNSYFIDPTTGIAGNTGRTMRKARSTLAGGYALLEAGQNDNLYYLNGTTSLSFATATTTWAKNYTHFWGVGAPTRVGQRSRIFNSGDAAYPLMTISASGCSFGNMYWFDGTAHASANCCTVSGSRNYFENIHFAGLGHATASAGTASSTLMLTGSENTFVNCTIGIDTIKRTGDNAIIFLDGGATRNQFINCRIVSWAETNTYPIVELVDTLGADRYTIFENCLFYNFWTNHGGTLLEVFTIPASSATHDIILKNCLSVGSVEWESGDRGQIFVDNIGGASTTGIGLAPAV